jgi:hypothetical protein
MVASISMPKGREGGKRPAIDWRNVMFPPRQTCAKCLGRRKKLALAGLDWNLEFECRRCDYIREHVRKAA